MTWNPVLNLKPKTEKFEERVTVKIIIERIVKVAPSMRRRSNVSKRSHIGRDVVDHAETSSRRRNRNVIETDLFETSLRRLIGTWKKLTYLRRHSDVPIDT